MHGNRKIAEINTRGEAVILALQFFPYDLYLEEERDFNQSFGCYDTLEGENCQTVYPERKTQREAAIEAVQHIGLPQMKEIDSDIFEDETQWKERFFRRLEELKRYCR